MDCAWAQIEVHYLAFHNQMEKCKNDFSIVKSEVKHAYIKLHYGGNYECPGKFFLNHEKCVCDYHCLNCNSQDIRCYTILKIVILFEVKN